MNVTDAEGRPYDMTKLINLTLAGIRTKLIADPSGRDATLSELSNILGPVVAMQFATTLVEGDCTPLQDPAPPCQKKGVNTAIYAVSITAPPDS
jgi:hypothetical protein